MISLVTRRMRRIAWIGLISLWFISGAAADPSTQAFLDGIRHYQNGDYEKSIAEFQKVADAGVQNGQLFYNLGNAYLRNHDLGHAVLWYERALKLTPEDPDLRFNYAYALSQTKDERGDKGTSLVRILFFWKFLMNPVTIRWIAIGLNLFFWVAVLFRMIRRKKIWKTPIYLLFLAAVIFSGTAAYNYYEDAYIQEAVILPEKASIRSGLTEGATELFVLHAGTKIRVEREKDGYVRIFFSEGKIGWVKKSQVGII